MIYSCVLHSLIYICLHSSSEAIQELSRDAVTVDESPCEEEGSKDENEEKRRIVVSAICRPKKGVTAQRLVLHALF